MSNYPAAGVNSLRRLGVSILADATVNFDAPYSNGQSPFGWCYQTVRAILKDRVYTGDMVNHKFEIVNYKTKERAAVPEEERIIVANRHEPLVSREDFERVQQILAYRHKPRKHDFDNVFKDLTFCAECGYRMTLMMKPLKAGLTPIIRCTNHYNNPHKCKHNHYIYYDVLYTEVLKRIQNVAERVESGELLRSIQKHTAKQAKADKLDAEKVKIAKRLQVLKKIIKKLYEDFASDLLDADNYHGMLTEYTQEQKKITARLAVIENELVCKDSQTQNVEKLKAVLDEYLHVETLDANII